MDPLRDLPLFAAVAEARSFTRAAAVLAMPTSTLSRRLAALETALGVRLLERNTRRVELTEAGELYLARARAILDAAHDATHEVRGLAEQPRGLLRLSIEAEVGPRLVAPVIAEFLAQYPEVRIDLDLSPRRVDLLAEGFDVAVRIGLLPDSALTVRRVGGLAGALYATPAYLARAGTPAHPDDLPGHDRVHLLHKGDRGHWHLSRGGVDVEVAGPGRVSANNMTMIRYLAREGLGIAVLDRLMATEDVAAGRLVPVLPAWTMPPMPLSILTPAKLLPAKTRRFVDLLAARIGGAIGLPDQPAARQRSEQ